MALLSTGRLRSSYPSLADANVRLLVIRTLLFSTGNAVHTVSIGWLAWQTTGSAVLTGVAVGIRSFPLLIVSPLVGVLIDRMDRSRVLLMNSVYMAALGIGFTTLAFMVDLQIWHLVGFMLLSGFGWAVNRPTRRAIYADAVPAETLLNALAVDATAFAVARVAAPAAVGIIIVALGVNAAFVAQAVLYTSAALLTFRIRIVSHDTTAAKRSSFFANLREGFAYAFGHQVILALLLLAFIGELIGGGLIHGLVAVFADEALDGGADAVGWLLTAAAVGGVLGPTLLSAAGRIEHQALVLVLSNVVTGLAIGALFWVGWLPVAMLVFAVLHMSGVVSRVLSDTLTLVVAGTEYRGRIAAIGTMVAGIGVVSGFLAGTMAEAFGVSMTMLLAGITVAVSTIVIGISFRSLYRRYD